MTDTPTDPVKAEKARIFRERLAKAKEERAAAGITSSPNAERSANPIERARKNPNSLKMAIAAKCYDCQGRDSDPHPRWRIGNCVCPECPLWSHRPYQQTRGKPIPPSLRYGFNSATDQDSPEETDEDDAE